MFSVAILYMVYMLFFRAQKSLVFNRIFLFMIVLIGIMGAFITNLDLNILNNSDNVISSKLSFSLLLDELKIASNNTQNNFTYSSEKIILITYLTISSLLFLSLLYRILGIIKLVYSNETIKDQGFTFVILEGKMQTFSFFHYIFISESIYKNSKISEGIISHEKVHAIQKHSIDILLAELLIIIQWINPISYLLKRSIRENHEFLADKGVLLEFSDLENYKLLLLQNSNLLTINSITHNFSYSLLKKRINMMTRKNSKVKLVLGAIILPIAFGITILACSSPQKDEALTEEITTEKVTSEQAQKVTEETVFTVVETMPEFPGGKKALYKFLGDNIKYPAKAKEDGIQGQVFVNFIIETNGSVTNVNILRGVNSELDKEAERAVKIMPNWKPGEQRGEKVRVSYNLPIKFVLD